MKSIAMLSLVAAMAARDKYRKALGMRKARRASEVLDLNLWDVVGGHSEERSRIVYAAGSRS